MLMKAFTKLRTLFIAWTLVAVRQVLSLTRIAISNKKIRSQASIWNMRKENLIEKALREIPGATLNYLRQFTVPELRQILKDAKEQQIVQQDPLATLPKGMTHMKLAELTHECLLRELPTETHAGGTLTRSQMMIQIRQDVMSRQNVHSTASDWLEIMSEDSDQMEDIRSHTRRRTEELASRRDNGRWVTIAPDNERHEVGHGILSAPARSSRSRRAAPSSASTAATMRDLESEAA